MVANYGNPSRSGGLKLFAAVLVGVFAAGLFSSASAQQTSMQKHRARTASSPFNLNAGPNAVLQANLVQCGIDNQGNVCTNIFNSPTGGGGFWPTGTTNQYIFNSGLQIAGINGPDAGPWSGDTVGAYFFDARGTQPHGEQLTDVYNSLNASDVANWPAAALATDTTLFNPDLVGENGIVAVSDQDSWVQYWDGNPDRISKRDHPMGIRVEQRSLAFNAPAGAEHTIFFIYKFTNISNDPAFQAANEQKFKIQLPDAGWTITNIYAAFGMDPDVTSVPTANFSTGILPFNMGVAYEGDFATSEFNFTARSDLYAPPFFVGPGFVGVKYLKSPIDPETGREVGLTLFSNTTNGGTFPDPEGVKQLFRYLKGDVSSAAGDPSCTIPNSIQRRLCALVQDPADTRFFQASGPFSLPAGQSAVIVVAYTHAAPVLAPGYTPGSIVRPGIPSVTPGVGADTIRTIERIAGLLRVPADAVATDASGTFIDESKLRVGRDVVPGSVIANGIVARTIFENKFLLPRPPASPTYTLVPGNNQITVVWEPSPSEQTGDPYYKIASDPASPLYNPNYRQFDVEGYRIYRATGLSGGFDLIAQFDKTGTTFVDFTGELDPEYVPEEGVAYTGPVEHDLTGTITQYPAGGRIRDAVTGGVIVTNSSSLQLENTGVPFVFIDRSVRNGITYRYIVTAFDVNSMRSGAISLESPRTCEPGVCFAVPRTSGQSLTDIAYTTELRGATKALNPDAALPTIDAQGRFSGPMPPSPGLTGTDFAAVLPQALKTGAVNAVRIDSVVPYGYGVKYFVTAGLDKLSFGDGGNGLGDVINTSAGLRTMVLGKGQATVEADTVPTSGVFTNAPKFAGFLEFELTVGSPQFASGVADWAPINPAFWVHPPDAGAVAGGSRWFEGANETAADPTLNNRHGELAGITTIGSPVPNVGGVNNLYRRFMQGMFGAMRAADVQVTWENGQITRVYDITHDVPVPFKARPQAGWGFIPDADGNGVLDYNDTAHLLWSDDLGGWHVAGANELLVEQPVVMSVDANGDGTPDGTGFALLLNGEPYWFVGNPPASATWTHRSYFGEVLRTANGYTFNSSYRPPAVPGLVVALNVTARADVATNTDLSRVHTVPDPYYVRSAFELGPSSKELRFVNLPNQAIVRIYTLNGTLVRVLTHDEIQGGGELKWDLRNRNNQFVASGVYFYVVEGPDGKTKTGKFTIVQFAR